VRIGLIGLGRIGAFHARTLAAIPSVRELVVTDTVPGLAEQVAAGLAEEVAALPDAGVEVRVVATPADLLDAGVDGVVIASSTPTHAGLIRACVERGTPAFCEKPVALAAAEATALREDLAGSAVPVQIGFPRRFDQAYVAARGDLLAGRLGTVHTVRSTTLDPAPPPEAYIRASGGIFHDCAIHDFDSVRWATGQEVVEVMAVGSNQHGEETAYIAAAGDAEAATSILTLSGGTLAVVSNARTNGRGHDVRLELLGTRDSVVAGLDDRTPLRSADAGIAFPAGPPWVFFMDRFADAFRAELAAFTEVVAGTRPSPCTLRDGVQASLVAEAATRSFREHRPVRLEEVRS
jgi:myo-inositol 2-dehydrogenase/D-chiro-inositol 1-dehydrogenase